jgi:hypothetical protein
VARGGRGGADAGIGGAATSHAEGTAIGGGPVDVRALALGGNGGPAQQNPNFPRFLGDGGAANSSAVARGSGEVFALASALAGHSGRFAPEAAATATAEGAAGSAVAEAATRVDTFGAIYARADSSVAGGAIVEARAAMGDVAADAATPRDAFAAVAGLPRNAVVAGALLGNDLLSSLVDQPSDVLALAHWRAQSTRVPVNGASILLRSEFQLDLPGFFFGASGLYLGLLNPEAGSTGFDSLRFLVDKDGESLVDRVFADSNEALEFFDDQALDLGDLTYPGSTIRLLMELTASDPGAGFGSDLLVAWGTVPEPSTLLLVALGMACLAVRQRSAGARRSARNRPGRAKR